MVSLLLQALILCPDPYISSENTIMDQAHSDKVPVTFQEFVARFSENEMKLLQEWQKELYQNVMKEIEHALISLGPHIARSVFSLRAKDKQELFVMEHEDTETRLNVSQYTNSPSCISVSIPAIEQDDVNLVEVPDIKGESSAVPSTRSVPFNTTKDANTNTMDQQRSEKTDQMISHTGQPLAELGLRQSCINEKGAIFVEEEDAKRRSIAGPVVTAVFSLGSNSEEDMHCKVKEEPDGRISELELVEGPKAADIICSVGFEEPVDGGDAAGSKEVHLLEEVIAKAPAPRKKAMRKWWAPQRLEGNAGWRCLTKMITTMHGQIKGLVSVVAELREKVQSGDTSSTMPGTQNSPGATATTQQTVSQTPPSIRPSGYRRKGTGKVLPDIPLPIITPAEGQLMKNLSRNCPGRMARLLFKHIVGFKRYQRWGTRANYDGTDGKDSIPLNVKQCILQCVAEHYSGNNITICRQKINELLRMRRRTPWASLLPAYTKHSLMPAHVQSLLTPASPVHSDSPPLLSHGHGYETP